MLPLRMPQQRGSYHRGASLLGRTFETSKLDEFRIEEQKRDELGIDHVTYQQYFSGMRVEGGVYKLHGKGDAIESMNGKWEV